MAIFRRRTATVLKKATSDGETVEERKTLRIGGQKVEVRRVEEGSPSTGRARQKPARKTTQSKRSGRSDTGSRSTGSRSTGSRSTRGRANGRPPAEQEIIIPTDVCL